MNIAIIPARGGSKRIPRKNIIDFNGLPMIAYPISAALNAENIDHVYVSTDDHEIASIASSFGAQVPFQRPSFLCDDFTPTKPVITHSILELHKIGIFPAHICCLYPCTPLLNSTLLDKLYRVHVGSDSPFTYPVLRYSHPIQRAMTMTSSGKMEMSFPEFELSRTQDLPPRFHDAGQFYWGSSSGWLAEDSRMHSDSLGVEISASSVVDIDNFDDLELAKLMHKASISKDCVIP